LWRKAKVTLEFVTPGFVGGASGNAQLRFPPLKYLFRFWWWVALWPHVKDLKELREQEGRIFGNACLRSKVKNQLAFKVLEDAGRLKVVVFHKPFQFPYRELDKLNNKVSRLKDRERVLGSLKDPDSQIEEV